MKRKWRHDQGSGARRATSLSLPQPAAEADASDSSAAARPFLPGDEVTAAADHHRYRLESVIRSGPRSTVWKAATQHDGRPVAIKVLKSGSPEQQASALQELSIMQQITHSRRSKHHAKQAAAAAAGAGGGSHRQASHSAASASSSPSSGTTHLVQLLDSLQVSQHSLAALQQPQQQDAALPVAAATQQQRVVEAFRVHPALSGSGPAAEPAAGRGTLAAPSAAVAASSTAAAAAADEGCGAVLLVLEPLHQSLSWVLHFLRQRAGRLGLPSFAVRRLAHQLLTGLAELHDASAVVHRDIKPSNLLLKTPYVMRKDQQLMRSMTLAELAAAQWSIIDLGSAARLLPPTAEAATAAAAAAASNPAPAAARGSQGGLLGGLAAWLASVTGGGGGAGVVTADSPSSMRWQVAAGALVPYETPAYTPPEALLQLPATAAYDIWSAACVIYEAATGRLLFPLEAAASASGLKLPRGVRPSGDLMRLVKTAAAAGNPVAADAAAAAASGGSEAAEDEPSSEEVELMLDELHLILMRNVAGPPPPQLLAASPIADDLFSNKVTGTTWLEHDEADGGLGLWGLGTRTRRTAPQRRSLLHQLMASRSMSLDEAVALTDLLTPMLSWDPADRPTAAQLLMHPYFKPLADGRDVPQQQQQQQQQVVATAAGPTEQRKGP